MVSISDSSNFFHPNRFSLSRAIKYSASTSTLYLNKANSEKKPAKGSAFALYLPSIGLIANKLSKIKNYMPLNTGFLFSKNAATPSL